MSIVRVCRHEEFEISHMLDKYEGKCGRIHGHTYKAEITLEGRIIEDPFSNSYGMLMDFNELKQIIKNAIPDHYYISNEEWQEGFQAELRDLMDKYEIPYKTSPTRSTVENMVGWYAKAIQDQLPDDVFVVEVKLYETTNSYGLWRIEDHPSHKYDEFRKENVVYED